MTLQFGLEKESFVYRDGNDGTREYVLASETPLSYDECGYLAEARGDPYSDIIDAVFSLKSNVCRLEKLAHSNGLHLDDTPIQKLNPSTLLLEARRRHAKGPLNHRNFKGFAQHRNARSEQTAGLHLSVTDRRIIYTTRKEQAEKIFYNHNFDWLSIFWRLDGAFKDEIKAAKRNRGFYEMKSDGRVEYRSLPANVDLDKLIDVVRDILKELHM